ncbi:MAG TPA: helix-turn-helix domain-containing protein [Clostridia bacterium]
MTTGEKIAFLRKRKGLTQEQMAEILEVSRQSVSRWEIDMAFPETEKLIKLSRLLECSIDYLLNESGQEVPNERPLPSVHEAYRFIRDCGYFFLATAYENRPNQRPMGMIICDGKNLYIGTDRRNNVFAEIMNNPHISLASYNLHTRKWIRITGDSFEETAIDIYNAMRDTFPMLKQKYTGEDEVYFAILRINISSIEIEH